MFTIRAYRTESPHGRVVRHRLLPRALAVGATLVTATALAAGTASACESTVFLPDAETASAIAAAVHASPFTSAVPADAYTVADTRLARSDPSWALVDVRPRTDTVGPAIGVVQDTESGWQLVELGTYEVGCDLAPASVLGDFGLSCPPGAVAPYA